MAPRDYASRRFGNLSWWERHEGSQSSASSPTQPPFLTLLIFWSHPFSPIICFIFPFLMPLPSLSVCPHRCVLHSQSVVLCSTTLPKTETPESPLTLPSPSVMEPCLKRLATVSPTRLSHLPTATLAQAPAPLGFLQTSPDLSASQLTLIPDSTTTDKVTFLKCKSDQSPHSPQDPDSVRPAF